MAKTCAVLLADGFETIEALAPADCLARAGAQVSRAGCTGSTVTSAQGVPVVCDAELTDVDLASFDLVIVPGGLGGVDNLRACPAVAAELKRRAASSDLLGCICAAPALLAENGLLDGRVATCYPGCDTDFPAGVRPEKNGVYRDGNLVTASGPAFAVPFGLALVAALLGEEDARRVASAMLVE